MMDRLIATTESIAFNRTLARVGLAAAVLLATVLVGGGSAVAAPVDASPANGGSFDSGTPTMEGSAGGPFVGSEPTTSSAPGSGDFSVAGESTADPGSALQMEVQGITEERIVVEARYPDGPVIERVYLGSAEQFEISEDTVSLPEDTDGLARPVETRAVAGHEGHWMVYFRTEDINFSQVDEGKVTMGLRVVGPGPWGATDTVRFSPGDGVKPA